MSNLKQNGEQRWAPSYLRRRGQMTPGQKQAFREQWDAFGIEFRYGETIDLDSAFPGDGPLVLEIGFGMGENLLHLANQNPDCRFLGIEVHKPGIGAVLKAVPENVRVMRGDARLILTDHITEAIFDRILIFFPDPWPDAGNQHRRLIQPEFVGLLEERLKPGGVFHIATDVDDYAEHIQDVMAKRKLLAELPDNWRRTTSKYETKGLARGNQIHDLVYQRD